jgi:transmembrane sensor
MRSKEEAAAWLLRLQDGEAPHAERDAFVDWLRESPLHVAEMLRVTNVHEGLVGFRRWDEVDTQGRDGQASLVSYGDFRPRDSKAVLSQRPRQRWPMLSSIAACALVVVAVSFWLAAVLGSQSIRTDRGERREVTLSDGSVVQIDPESTLRVKFDEHARRIELLRGRAVFRVAKNPTRPFWVQADDTIVRAVGTAFGVERRNNSVRVTVSEGRVAIVSADPSATPLPPSLPGRASAEDRQTRTGKKPGLAAASKQKLRSVSELVLSANQQITVRPAGIAESVRQVDSNRELAWAQGRLAFEREAVATVIEDFNRYNQTQLQVEDPQLAAQLVSGVFDASDPESFIAFLQSMIPVKVLRHDDARIVLTAGR